MKRVAALSRLLGLSLFASSGALVAPAAAAPPEVPELPRRPLPTSVPLDETLDMAPDPKWGTFDEAGAFIPNPRLLKASRELRRPIRAENAHALRMRNPEYHAITAAPDRAGIRPMAEWEPMSALVLAFPGEYLSDTNATTTVIDIIRYGHEHGDVWVMVDSSQAENGLRQRLVNAGVPSDRFGSRIRFHRTTFDSIWLIDFAPWPLVDEASDSWAFLDFRYYYDRPLDDAIPTRLARMLDTAFGAESKAVTYRAPLTTEGGTLMATTEGVCFTSSRQIFYMSCLDPANAGACDDSILSLDLSAMQQHRYAVEMREILEDYAGCRDLVVLHSVSDDGTGHLDMFFKTLDDDRVLLGEYRAPFANAFQQENALLMDENAAFLSSYRRPNGETYTVERIIMPGHRVMQGFGQVPFSYINSTYYNGVNLWPATDFADWRTSRDEAQATWERVLPDMTHQWIDATNLSFYSGAIHCITRTLPASAIGAWIDDGTCDTGTCDGPDGGYDGACSGEGVAICFGPAWLCGCNDCDNNCQDPCRGVGYEGCCNDGNVVSCENGVLIEYDCARTGCGWNDWGGFYDCQESGAEPSGTYPIACAGCEPNCEGRECGDDGCGGQCGTCEGEAACVTGTCRDDCFECTVGEIGCDGTVAWMCNAPEGGCKTKTRVDCADFGRICQAGDCIDDPNPEPVVEPAPEAVADEAPNVVEAPVKKAKDDGCGGGESAGWLALLAVLGIARRRRS